MKVQKIKTNKKIVSRDEMVRYSRYLLGFFGASAETNTIRNIINSWYCSTGTQNQKEVQWQDARRSN